MKIGRSVVIFTLLFGLAYLKTGSLRAQQANFQFAPAPIAYPYFEPGRADFKVGGGYGSISGNNITISGGGAYGIARKALNEQFAVDGALGLFGVSGKTPGFALPFWYSGLRIPIITGKATLTGVTFPLLGNLEFQAIHSPKGSLILFGGMNMSLSSLTLQTPYYVSGWGHTQFTTNATASLVGFQFGIQAGIPLGNFNIVPFMMMITDSGSASFTFKTGYQNTTSIVTGGVVNIQPFTTTSTGMDIIYVPWNLSLGTLWQQAASNGSQNGFKTVLIQLSWHFRPS